MHAWRLVRLTMLALVATVFAAQESRAGDVRLTSNIGGEVAVPVVSYAARPFLTVVRQEHDFSCGSAAVATLLTFHFERPTTERQAFEAMYAIGDKAKIQREGFSLLEMKTYLGSLGYEADGFRVPLDKVARVGVPVIVLIETRGYKHFVVVKGLRDDRVLVGDPARGVEVMSIADFHGLWKDGIVFAIHNADAVGRRHFNDEAEWRLRSPAPVGSATNRTGLASFTVMLPGALSTFQ
ncbi:MAG TPA: C39 family peptidase [Methylomirabilota bacterium]|nr:C39 family peptidase [Methylomirabilota bacterium]